MDMMTVKMDIPAGMVPYYTEADEERLFARNAMMLYPLIQDLTLSHGKAAEILGINKIDLIEFYDSMGIPYLDQSEEDFMGDMATLEGVLEGAR